MDDVVLNITVPSDVLRVLGLTVESATGATKLAAVMFWFSRGVISEEMGARFAGLTRSDFLRALADAHVPVFDVDMDELRAEAGVLLRED